MSLPVLFFYGFAFVGLIHSFIFCFVAIKNKRTADLLITLYLFAQALVILEYVLYWSGLQVQYHYFNCISVPLLFLFGPLLFMYVEYVFSENKNPKKYLFHFAPALVVFILMLPYFFSTGDLKNFHYKMIKYFILDFRILVYFIMAHMSIYVIVILAKVKKQKRVGHINSWLLTIVFLFAFYVICYISYYYMAAQPWFTLTQDYFVSLASCISIVSIIYVAYGKNKILEGYSLKESIRLENIVLSFRETQPKEIESQKKNTVFTYELPLADVAVKSEIKIEPELIILPIEKYKNSGLTEDALNELALSLNELMQKEQLYRESELKLEMLSGKLGASKHQVSQVINQVYGVNFFEYINLLRIEEAKMLLSANDKKSMNIIEVAYAVGYSTKNTFNTAFRRIVGVTPTEYRRQHQIQLN
ncbi:MAG: AraC family transcriptional regulator [Bacteroidota bacterium]